MGGNRKLFSLLKAIFLVGGAIVTAYNIIVNFIPPQIIIKDSFTGIVIGVVIFMLTSIWIIYDLLRNYVHASNPKIALIPKDEETLTELKRRNFYPRASILEIYNHENREITNCYATLLSASDIFKRDGELIVLPLLPTPYEKGGRIEWQDTEHSSDKCEITIAPNSSRELIVADTRTDFHFNLCQREVEAHWMTNTRLHPVRIRIDGKFNGRSIKHKIFEGYIYSEKKTENAGFIVDTGEFNEKVGRCISERIDYTDMTFKEGNWMKNRKLRKELDLYDEAKKPLTRKGFFKILRKVTKPKPTDQKKEKDSD